MPGVVFALVFLETLVNLYSPVHKLNHPGPICVGRPGVIETF